MKTLNILLLGKSGVGKSTFINSFANNVAFESVNDIPDRNAIKVLIPCSFDVCDDEGILHNFKMGEEINQDGNESLNSIASGTQGCKSYEFDFKYLRINLIDTPGIVDTDGTEKDKKNIEAILDFISTFTSLDGICILLKPNEERLDAIMQYCIFELLCQLDKSATHNICFVFTNSRGTHYRPGGTAKAIQELFKQMNKRKHDLELKFSKQNFFCFDSEAFRFLISRDAMEFEEDEKIMFMQSWDKSRRECVRMINYISGLPQHDIQNMLSINKARRMIESLLTPLVDIADNILHNKQMCEKRAKEIYAAKDDITLLKSKLYVPRTKLVMEYYSFPRLVCNSKKCTERIYVDNEEKTHYKNVCYQIINNGPPATTNVDVQRDDGDEGNLAKAASVLAGITIEFASEVVAAAAQVVAAGTEALAAAAAAVTAPVVVAVSAAVAIVGVGTAFYFSTQNCSSCSCPISNHFLSLYETRKVIEEVWDEETLAKMEQGENSKVVAESALKNLHQELAELQEESKIINTASCTFAVFLECRAITSYNDAAESYLDYMLKANEANRYISDSDRAAKQKRLEEQKLSYQQEKLAIQNGCKGFRGFERNEISPKDIDIMVTRLCSLKRYGTIFSNALAKIEQMRRRANKSRVVKCDVSEKRAMFLDTF